MSRKAFRPRVMRSERGGRGIEQKERETAVQHWEGLVQPDGALRAKTAHGRGPRPGRMAGPRALTVLWHAGLPTQ